MRWNLAVWQKLFGRFIYEVASPAGTGLFFVGASLSFVRLLKGRSEADLFLWTWLLGVLSYVVVFLNLNFIHDYYQIPLLAIVSIFIAIAIELPIRSFGRPTRRFAWVLSLFLYGLVGVNSLIYAESHYYKLDSIRIEAGTIIERHTPPDTLIIAAPDIPTDCRDPRLLYRAKRNGWSVYKGQLSPSLITTLQGLGAQYLAVVARVADVAELYGYRVNVYPLSNRDWKVLIAKL
jgi:hypothetical protein